MTATLTHAPATFGGARKPESSKSSSSWLAKLLAALTSLSGLFAEVREEERKAHARYPHFIEW